ncbi:MAG TPA: hypothetical protein VGQ90_05190 [Stellaceae bacterium]|nr:hypothetical protein [Stellaceae bacterium]
MLAFVDSGLRPSGDRLVWFECYDDPVSAITREKDIKKWRREWKIRLIEEGNPHWLDRYDSIAE